MAIALETIVKQLEDSGIVAAGKLKDFVPPKAHPKNVEELVSELVKQNHLTKFQAQQVSLGKSKALILGNYTILDKIGAGGMGQVFKAEHRRLKRVVAIKMLPAAMLKDAAAVARFQREVEAAAKLRHPNIVATDDADEANGAHFLVMEYIEGKDLSASVKKNGPFSVAKAVNYILQAARGLEFAHSEGVIHRDIKPANLLLDKKGVVKILDMGLARIDGGINAPAQAELTGTGAVMGTVDYMAPEQAMSTRDADARADIYSLGCSLHYLIAGKATYGGESVIEKLLAHREKPIPNLRDVSSDVSEELNAVFRKMVAKNIEDRYQTITEVVADLERCSSGQSTSMSIQQSAGTNLGNSALTFMPNIQVAPTIQKTRVAKQIAAAKSGEGKQPPWKNTKVLIGAGAAGFLFLLLGVWVIIRDKDGNEVAKVRVPDGGTATVQTSPVVATPLAKAPSPVTPVPPPKTPPANDVGSFLGGAISTPTAVSSLPAGKWGLEFSDAGQLVVAKNLPNRETTIVTYEAWLSDATMNADAYQIVSGPYGALSRFFGSYSLYTYHGNASSSSKDAIPRRFHLAGVNDGKRRLLFVDGKLMGSTADAGGVHPEAYGGKDLRVDLMMGDHLTNKFRGVIDAVRVSSVARYNKDFTPPTTFTPDKETVALYLFDEGQGDTLKDSSGNGYHGKITGAKWARGGASAPPASVTPANPPSVAQAAPAVRWPLEPTAPPPGTQVQTPTIPAEALTFGGHRYLLVEKFSTWVQAKAAAEELGGHLVTINSVEERNFVRDQLWLKRTNTDNPGRKMFLGASSATPDGSWAWVTGEPIDNSLLLGTLPKGNNLGLFWANDNVWATVGIDELGFRFHYLAVEWDTLGPAVASANGYAPPLAVAPFDTAQAKEHQAAWAKHLGTQVATTNSVGAKMILIPPGEFMMGSTDEQVKAALEVAEELKLDQGTKDRIQKAERPQHRVVLTKPFLMGATEVTIGEFKKFSATGHQTEAEKAEVAAKAAPPQPTTPGQPPPKPPAPILTYLNPGYAVTDDLPAAYITWNDALAYCNWLSEQEKATYRLPTEAEWEYACRAGTTTQYSFGDNVNKLEQFGWYSANAGGRSHAVGTKPPNAFGLHDLHGNLYEWCRDYFDEKGYETSASNDPNGPASGSARVVRGGYWSKHASGCRSASRSNGSPSFRYDNFGFRCVRVLDIPATTANFTPQPSVFASASKSTTYNDPAFQQWMKDVAAMPADKQIEAVSKKVMELNPGFDGKMTGVEKRPEPKIENDVVTDVGFNSLLVTDLSPVRALAGLKRLDCSSKGAFSKSLSDLSPLRGLQLSYLSCQTTMVSDVSVLEGMPLTTLRCGITSISDLSPLRGAPLTLLASSATQISDLAPLAGMQLDQLSCNHLVSDLAPLAGMPLTSLIIDAKSKVTDLSPLESCRRLKSLKILSPTTISAEQIATLQKVLPNCKIEWNDPAMDAPTQKLAYLDPDFLQWIADVQKLPADKQIEAVSKKLMELNPGFDGKMTDHLGKGLPKFDNGVLTDLGFVTDKVTDISPVRALAGLKALNCQGSNIRSGRLTDLSPLEGMKLTHLICGDTQVLDLSPLEGMPLYRLHCQGTKVSDLSPLKGMPLVNLLCYTTPVFDLSPLEGMPLLLLDCRVTQVSDLLPLEKCKALKSVNATQTKVTPASVAALQKALPNCKIEWDDPAKPKTPEPAASGTK